MGPAVLHPLEAEKPDPCESQKNRPNPNGRVVDKAEEGLETNIQTIKENPLPGAVYGNFVRHISSSAHDEASQNPPISIQNSVEYNNILNIKSQILVRDAGIEPASNAWEALILPLN